MSKMPTVEFPPVINMFEVMRYLESEYDCESDNWDDLPEILFGDEFINDVYKSYPVEKHSQSYYEDTDEQYEKRCAFEDYICEQFDGYYSKVLVCISW